MLFGIIALLAVANELTLTRDAGDIIRQRKLAPARERTVSKQQRE